MAAGPTAERDARQAALGRLFDHAALFPPASMTMAEALAEDRRLRAAAEAWLVGRFVCPLSRLRELGAEQVRLSVVLDEAPDERLLDPRVEAVEVPPGVDVPAAVREVPTYVERPPDDLSWLEALASAGLRAKVRCGGRDVPTVPRLAAFVRRCRELSLAFKATAGLHHPIRGEREHGFLNVLAAAVFGEEEEVLAERRPDAFRLDADGLSWRGRRAGLIELAETRRRLLVGIGSCSIREPVDDLRALGIVPS